MDAAELIKCDVRDGYIFVQHGTPEKISNLVSRGFYILTADYDYTGLSSVFIIGPSGIISTLKNDLSGQIDISYSDGVITFTNANYGNYGIFYRLTRI